MKQNRFSAGIIPGDNTDRANATTYGAFFAGELNYKTAADVAEKLGVKIIRTGQNMDQFKGKNDAVAYFKSRGFAVALNVNFKTVVDDQGVRHPQPFAADLNQYKTDLDKVLSVTRPDYLFIENEETVRLFHSGTVQQYVLQLQAAKEVADFHGIPISNGGLVVRPALQILPYRALLADGRSYEAEFFYENCMDSTARKYCLPGNKTIDALCADVEYLLREYDKMRLSYINMHWYEPLIEQSSVGKFFSGIGKFLNLNSPLTATPNALTDILWYISTMTDIPVISNETGILVADADLMTSVIKNFKQNNVHFMCWFSATSANGKTIPLNDGTNLTPLGTVYANTIKK